MRHNNTPINKVVLLQTRREVMKRRTTSFCTYCKKPNHDEHHCKTKRIDDLENLLKKNKIQVPGTSKDSTPTSSKGKGQALVENKNSSSEWILDLGASYHIGSSKEDFSSLKQS